MPIVQQSLLNEIQSMKDTMNALQIQVAKNKDDTATEVMKKLRPLAEEIYNEVMPKRYRCPTFCKYSGETNPWDHVTLFEIECGSIGNNDKLKAQQFPSTFTGQDRKSTRLNSSHSGESRMPSSA